jgi:hypothetical protein
MARRTKSCIPRPAIYTMPPCTRETSHGAIPMSPSLACMAEACAVQKFARTAFAVLLPHGHFSGRASIFHTTVFQGVVHVIACFSLFICLFLLCWYGCALSFGRCDGHIIRRDSSRGLVDPEVHRKISLHHSYVDVNKDKKSRARRVSKTMSEILSRNWPTLSGHTYEVCRVVCLAVDACEIKTFRG